MASSHNRSTNRLSSLLSLGGGGSSHDLTEKLYSQSPSLRPLPASRDPSPARQPQLSNAPSRSSSPVHNFSRPGTPQSPSRSPTRLPSLRPPFNGVPGDDGFLLPPPKFARADPTASSSPPGSQRGSQAGSAPGSPLLGATLSRPSTPSTLESKLRKRRSWMPGRSRNGSQADLAGKTALGAWVVGAEGNAPYDVSQLVMGNKITELWDDGGDTLVFLYPRETGRGPSIKLNSFLYSSSTTLTTLAHGNVYNDRGRRSGERQRQALESRTQQLSLTSHSSSPPPSRPGSTTSASSRESRTRECDVESTRREIHLYVPILPESDGSLSQPHPTQIDLDALVAVRNLFALLLGQPLVATSKRPSIFSTFMAIANLLKRYEFSNFDGSNYGEIVETNFLRYIGEFDLADVRASREKTIEALVLGEQMRSWEIYNEGFVHAAGKWDEIVELGSPNFHLISVVTRTRVERASMDLFNRLRNVRHRLEDFDFPTLFAGYLNSSSSDESKMIRFKGWKSSFMSMRKHIMSIYKQQYGSWPPKAKSKKNDFDESGLNRLLLLEVYQDFCDLYDMLVDRAAFTTRQSEMPSYHGTESADPQEPTARALRRVMNEYDHSSPPVLPPMPFDTPLVPSLSTTRRGFESLDPKKQAKEQLKKLKDDEINKALMQSYNRDSVKSTPFLEAFMLFERKSAHGKSMDEIAELRAGQWIFMYAVLQLLPLLVVDAPGIKCTKGVGYFLCQVPKGSAPWTKADSGRKISQWYGIAGGAGVVSLPADIVDHGTEGIYRRSHCWKAAEKWTGHRGLVTAGPVQADFSEDDFLPPPPNVGLQPDLLGSRSISPDRRGNRRSAHVGLEALPLPEGIEPSGARAPSRHGHDPSKSFEDILGQDPSRGKKRH